MAQLGDTIIKGDLNVTGDVKFGGKTNASIATTEYVDSKVMQYIYGVVFGGWHMYADGENLTDSADFTTDEYDQLKVGNYCGYPSQYNSGETINNLIVSVTSGWSYKSAGGRFYYKTITFGSGTSYTLSTDYAGSVYKGDTCGESSGGGAVACFTSDTLISTEKGMIPISEIKEGDLVYSYNKIYREIELKEVDKLVSHTTDTIYNINLGSDVIKASYSHPFSVVGRGVIVAQDINPGDKLETDNGFIKVSSVTMEKQDTEVYEIRVVDNHNYFVSDNKVLVYNELSILDKDSILTNIEDTLSGDEILEDGNTEVLPGEENNSEEVIPEE